MLPAKVATLTLSAPPWTGASTETAATSSRDAISSNTVEWKFDCEGVDKWMLIDDAPVGLCKGALDSLACVSARCDDDPYSITGRMIQRALQETVELRRPRRRSLRLGRCCGIRRGTQSCN
jgi:hypothetical protein